MGRTKKIDKLLESYILYSYFVEDKSVRAIAEDIKKRANITVSKTAVHKIIKKSKKYGVEQLEKRLSELTAVLCDENIGKSMKTLVLYNVLSDFIESFLRELKSDTRAFKLEKVYYFDCSVAEQMKKLLNIEEDFRSIEVDPTTRKLVVFVESTGVEDTTP